MGRRGGDGTYFEAAQRGRRHVSWQSDSDAKTRCATPAKRRFTRGAASANHSTSPSAPRQKKKRQPPASPRLGGNSAKVVAPDGSVFELDECALLAEEAGEQEDPTEINRELHKAEQAEARNKRAADQVRESAAELMTSTIAQREKAAAAQRQYAASQVVTAELATTYAKLKNINRATTDATSEHGAKDALRDASLAQTLRRILAEAGVSTDVAEAYACHATG